MLIEEASEKVALTNSPERIIRVEQPVSSDEFRQLARNSDQRYRDINRNLVTRVMVVKSAQVTDDDDDVLMLE